MLIHPRSYTLARFADVELSPEKQKRVAAHLAECARCRATVASVRALGDAARASAAPPAGHALWERIAARRAAGERMLPAADAREGARGSLMRNVAATAAAVAAIVFIAILGVEGIGVASQGGTLSFQPAHPRAGTSVRVRYRPASQLAGESKLVLRARYFPRAPFYWDFDASRMTGVVASALTKEADGSFAGAFDLPAWAVYAQFAVSDGTGEKLDNDRGGLWELVTAGADGRLSFDGLVARASRRQGSRARSAADSLVAIYPDSARSWMMRVAVEGSSRIPHWLSVFAARERRFATLDSVLNVRASVSIPEMNAMRAYAEAIEDSAAGASWKARLCAAHPVEAFDILLVAARCAPASPAAAHAQLESLEQVWERAPQLRPLTVGAGLGTAYRAEDREGVRRWAIRDYETSTPGYEAITDAAVLDTAVRRVMFARMRANIRLLLSDSLAGSSLIRPRANDSIYRAGIAMWQLGRLSTALMGFQGQYFAARDTLNVAIALIPNACNAGYLYALRALAEHKLGDTAAARRDALAWKGQGLTALGFIGDSITRVIVPRYRIALDSLRDSAPDRRCFNWAARPK